MEELWKASQRQSNKQLKAALAFWRLMIIGLAILAVFFFRGADVKVQVVIFVMLFFGVLAFGVAVLKVPPLKGPTLVASNRDSI